ncbi:hypothetical protein [Cohaesibacter marisflavi]|uniref:hypothetical protein n=1 Tax=Cohaesibacter marisflavi TaxID=655353 RepID=UPI0029C6229C|nr:hypothetical protein [Cohaesibacter marisflavi]
MCNDVVMLQERSGSCVAIGRRVKGQMRDCMGLRFAGKAVALLRCLLHDQLHAFVEVTMEESFG